MKKLSAVLLSSLLAVSAFAEQPAAKPKATSMDDLLNKVQQGYRDDVAEAKKREAEFKRAKSRQDQMLRDAYSEQTRQEKRSERLEATFADNEIKLSNKTKQLNERLGALKELFGHLTGSAGDLRENFKVSVTSAQFDGREEKIDALIKKMSDSVKLPTVEEIEGLWFEMNREMVESGNISRFNREIILVDGSKETRELVRVGTFNLMSEGEYLKFDTAGDVSVLARQPDDFMGGAEDLQYAEAGEVTMTGIDPTGPFGGQMLAALINSPSLTERWHQGREVGYIITAVGVFALIYGLIRLFALIGIYNGVKGQLARKEASDDNALGRILKVYQDNTSVDPETLEMKLAEAIIKERPDVEKGLAILKIISVVAPLMGLLGTVTGMIVVFQAITIYGAGDPTAMAGGISGALVTTVLGLIVAIPTVLIHTVLNGRAQTILHILEEQSAGIIATQAKAQEK